MIVPEEDRKCCKGLATTKTTQDPFGRCCDKRRLLGVPSNPMLMAATGRINVQTVNPFEARKIGAKNLTAEDAGYAEENAEAVNRRPTEK